MKKLELYFFPECPYCQIVEDALKQTGLDKNIIYYNIRANDQFRQTLMKATGRGTVPCLFIDGQPMHESRDIIAWLSKYAREISQLGDK